MQLLYYAPKLTAPTVESLKSYADDRFKRLARFLPSFPGEHTVKISVHKERHSFVISVEISIPKPVFIQVKDTNLYAAIDKAYDVAKKSVRRYKGKVRRKH